MIKPCTLILAIAICTTAYAKNYYVDGASSGDLGTLASPFKTIQKASTVAVAGDTIFIRKGIYRETITPANSGSAGKPIVYTNYKDEVVTISATEQVSKWVLEKSHPSGKVWKAKMNGTLNLQGQETQGLDQIFVDGEMQTEARWPNISGNPAIIERSSYAVVEGAKMLTTGVDNQKVSANYTDNELPSLSSNSLIGAYVHFFSGAFWWPVTGKVTAKNGTNFDFTYEFEPGDAYALRAGDIYFLWGKYELLDAPREWFRRSDDTVFVYMPNGDSPNNHLVEAKKRSDIFALQDKAYITIRNLKILGGGIKTNAGTTNLTIDGIDAQYTAHSSIVYGWWYAQKLGIVLNGANSVVSNSHIAYAVEDGVKLTGNNSKAYNNVIHDAGYLGMAGLLLGCSGDNMELKNNTVWGSGGPNAIDFRESSKSKVWYNDASECGKGTFDGGIMMATRDFDGQNTEVAYNHLHDGKGLSDGAKMFYGTSGIYFEGNTKNYLLHHNLMWNISAPGISIPTFPGNYNQNFKIYNNTLYDSPIVISAKEDVSGSEVKNNIFRNFEWNIAGATFPIENNITTGENYGPTRLPASNKYAADPKYIDKVNGNFIPAAGFIAIDAGLVLAPYTDAFVGTAPDIGALESGKAAFVAGALARPRDVADIVVTYDNASFPNKKFTVSGLPAGRKIASNTKLKIGTASSGGNMEYNFASKATTFTNVPKGNLTGIQDIYLDLGQDGIHKTKSTIDLGGVVTQLDDAERDAFSVFPNPASGSFEVRGSQNFHKIEIFNSSGNLVYVGSTKMVDAGKLPQGLYLVYAYGSEKVFQTKVVLY
ncbi:MAG TPA: T9SS type A sorting domain-containing protein [Cytophagaceae bacterium]|jgi:hypothetical protein